MSWFDLRRKWVSAVAVLGLCGPMASAWAVEVCVDSNAELAAALDVAQSDPMTIKVVQGTYALGATVWHEGSGTTVVRAGTELLGGYTAGCAGRSVAVGNTVFNDPATTSMRPDGALPYGDLTIEGITFALVPGLMISAKGHAIAPNATLLLRRNAFLNTSHNLLGVAWDQSGDAGGTVRIVNTVIAGNASGGLCSMFVIVDRGAPEVRVINNTVYDNAFGSSGGAGACLYNHYPGGNGSANFKAYNNIFYRNATVDLSNDGALTSIDNILGVYGGTAPVSQAGNLNVDPKLANSLRPIEVPPSPAINSGSNIVPGGLPSVDLSGSPRVVGGTVDRGAYESSIDTRFVQTVTSTADTATPGTLRSAITNVNANGGGEIRFNIAGGCSTAHVIVLNSALDTLAADMSIDGFSQPGATPNTSDPGDNAQRCIVLEASTSATPARALVVTSGNDITATIKGLAFSGFSTAAIDLQGGGDHLVTGNQFGGSVGGHALQPDNVSIRIGAAAHDATIGGLGAGERNLINGATLSGVVVQSGSAHHQILGNYIGVGWSPVSGYVDQGNGVRGVYLLGDDNEVSYNLIGHNGGPGMTLDGASANYNLVLGNNIGSELNDIDLGNAGAGIRFIGSSGDAPHDNTVAFNTIAHNGAQGVMIEIGQRNNVRINSIYANALLGLDLVGAGVLPNNDDSLVQPVDYANRGLNYPVLSAASGGAFGGQVSGTLTTNPGDVTIDFYVNTACDSSSGTNGEGRTWIGRANVEVPAPMFGTQGTLNFALPVSDPYGGLVAGAPVVATTSDANGNTSEFSACRNYVDDTLFVDGFQP